VNEKWCTCAQEGKIYKTEGWVRAPNGVFWNHVGCQKPSKANYMRWKNKNLGLVNQQELDWDGDIMEEFYYLLGDEDGFEMEESY